MDKPLFVNLDGGGVASLKGFRSDPLTSDPASPSSGRLWFNSVDNRMRYQDNIGTKTFANLGDISGSSPIVVGTTAPAIIDGSVLWVNQNVGYEGLYYFDTARGAWLDTSHIALHMGEDFGDNNNLGFAGINNAGNFTGYNLNFDYTIVGIHSSCRDINNNSKSLEIRRREAENATFSTIGTFDLTRTGTSDTFPGYHTDLAANIPVNAPASGRSQLYINVSGAGSAMGDTVVTLLIRKRGS